jgi:hypothetical protein
MQLCNKQHTDIDASDSGGATKYKCGFCSKTYRDAKVNNKVRASCKHGRWKG